jgi:hypothetical protein
MLAKKEITDYRSMPREEKEPQLCQAAAAMIAKVFDSSGVGLAVAHMLRGGDEKIRWRRRKIPDKMNDAHIASR